MLVFAQKTWPSRSDEILEAFSRVVSVNPVLDELLIIKESQPLQKINQREKGSESKALVAYLQSEGHFEIYYYSVEWGSEQNNLKSIFKPLFMVSPSETSFEKLSSNEKKIVSLTVDLVSKKKSKKWTSHLVPELNKWIRGQDLVPASCRKAVSKVENLLH